jgi:hypothetical protein
MARAIARSWEGHVSRRLRKKIEMLFAHLKRILKLDRLRLRGPNGARDEFLLAATAQNLRKLAKADTDAARKARLWEQFSSAIDYAVAGMAQSTAHFFNRIGPIPDIWTLDDCRRDDLPVCLEQGLDSRSSCDD